MKRRMIAEAVLDVALILLVAAFFLFTAYGVFGCARIAAKAEAKRVATVSAIEAPTVEGDANQIIGPQLDMSAELSAIRTEVSRVTNHTGDVVKTNNPWPLALVSGVTVVTVVAGVAWLHRANTKDRRAYHGGVAANTIGSHQSGPG